MQDGIMWGNPLIPILDDHLLPVLWAIAITANVLVEEMGIGDDPGVGGDNEGNDDIHFTI